MTDDKNKKAEAADKTEELLRKMLSDEEKAKAVPLAKHKRYAKRAMRRKKTDGHFDEVEELPEEATRSHLLPPRERIDKIPQIDLKAERELRASQRPPPPPEPKPKKKN